jgi:hypothetical protein
MRIFIVTLMLLLPVGTATAAECVVLLHGLARTSASLNKMQRALDDDGYHTANINYPSRHHKIEQLAAMAVDPGLQKCREFPDVEKIHFVTHSLGGILLRQYLSTETIGELGRVVMLGPPNQGSAAVDRLRKMPGFKILNGPAGRQLGKGENSIPLQLGPADFELGIIAGNRSIDPFTSLFLNNPDDGRVSVADTKLEGMTGFVIVRHSHALMMRMRKTIKLTKRFLHTGCFTDDCD